MTELFNPITVACVLNCGQKTDFYSDEEYEVYGDDWMCASCIALS